MKASQSVLCARHLPPVLASINPFELSKVLDIPSRATVVEAICASCALLGWFNPVSIGPRLQAREYIACQGQLVNPINQLLKEANAIFGATRKVACILSVGSGKVGPISMFMNNAAPIPYQLPPASSSACRITSDEVYMRFESTGVYHRFSVSSGLESLDNLSSRDFGKIRTYTDGYLSQPRVDEELQQAAIVSELGTSITIDSLCRSYIPRKNINWGLPPLTAFFVERTILIKSMYNALLEQDPKTQHIMILSGMGGIGKTQMVSRFFQKYEERFSHVLFIVASSESSIRKGLVARVRSFGPSYARTTAEEALEILAEADELVSWDWAIVFDSCDDPHLNISTFLPRCHHGSIVITTRNPQLGILSPTSNIEVDVMTRQEATSTLLRSADIKNPTEDKKTSSSGHLSSIRPSTSSPGPCWIVHKGPSLPRLLLGPARTEPRDDAEKEGTLSAGPVSA